jgi:hypothetical protein
MSDVKDLKKEEAEKQIKDETLDKVSGGAILNTPTPAPHHHQPSPTPVPKPEPL